MDDVTARFWAIMVGQCLGAIVIVGAGVLPYLGYGANSCKKTRKDTLLGLTIVGIVFVFVLLMLIIQFVRAMPFEDKITNSFVENVLWWFLVADIIALLFVVCQQGGLSRSAFLPIYFLIPAAYLAVSIKDASMYSIGILLILITMCLFISYLVSHKKMSELRFLSLRLSVTDFSTLHHKGYNRSFLIVSVVSLVIPALQFAFRAGYIVF